MCGFAYPARDITCGSGSDELKDAIDSSDGIVLVVRCAHPGIDKILEATSLMSCFDAQQIKQGSGSRLRLLLRTLKRPRSTLKLHVNCAVASKFEMVLRAQFRRWHSSAECVVSALLAMVHTSSRTNSMGMDQLNRRTL